MLTCVDAYDAGGYVMVVVSSGDSGTGGSFCAERRCMSRR